MEQLFLQVLNMSITAGYCVLAVLLVRLFLRKMPKLYSYVLWAVVWFRLVCPVSIKSVLSLVKVSTQTIPKDIGVQETPEIYSGLAQVDTVVNEGIRQTFPQVAAGDSVNPMQIVLSVAGVVWLVVAALLVLYSLWSVFRLKRQLADARWVEQNVYEAGNLKTPFVLGFFRPRIYLPESLKGQQRDYVLAHERTHVRRKDYLVKQLAFLVTCVYWFHPLIWLAFYQMCRDMEMSCDESVIRRLGGGIKKEYSASLLSLASGRQIVNGSPLAFGEGGVRARITNVLRYKRPTFWVSILFAVVLAVFLVGLALNPEEDDESGEMPVELTDICLADGSTSLPDGREVRVELWLLEGLYYDEEYAGVGGGTYAENYCGSYELRVVDASDAVLDQLGLNEDWYGTEELSINFPGEFEICFADYNGDGCPDFTIGTYGSSSVNLFYLYTIEETGVLRRLCDSEIPSRMVTEYSVVFEQDETVAGMPFYTYQWNNVTGEEVRLSYRWNEAMGIYEPDETEDADGAGDMERADSTAYAGGTGDTGETEAAEEVDADSYLQAVLYEGYLDESPYTYWNQDWNDCDFDGDGERDRVYRGLVGDGIFYRIHFGDGSVLELGEFEDKFTGLKLEAADVMGNGTPEILFVGMHMVSTYPMDMSEIALYSRTDGEYEMMSLPVPSHAVEYEYGDYAVGFDVYAKNMGDGLVALNCPDAGYEEVFQLEEMMTFLDIFGADPDTLTGECAYEAEFITYEGETCLALYEDIGGKWLYHPIRFVLSLRGQEVSQEFDLANVLDAEPVEAQ